MAETAVSTLPWPEIITTGMSGCWLWNTSSSCSPSRRAALHPDIEEHQARPPPGDFVEPGIGVVRLPGFETLVLEDAGDQVADVVFVVDDQNIECH